MPPQEQEVQKSTANIQAILFDWDGTIVDSYEAMFQSHRHAYMKHLGIVFPRDDSDFRLMVPMRLIESTARFGGDKASDIAFSYNQYYEQEAYKLGTIYEGVREVLTELRSRGYLLGVASNKSLSRVTADMDHLQLHGLMHAIVTSEDTVQRKPHPAPLLKLAEKLQVTPQHCVYIGDYRGDVIAAREAGMLSVAVMWGTIFPTDTLLPENPTYIAHHPQDLLHLFP